MENLIPDSVVNTAVIKEILESEPTQAYVTLKTKLAEIEERLSQTKGWFWKRSAITVVEQEKLLALRDIYQIALKQVVASIEKDTGNTLTINLYAQS